MFDFLFGKGTTATKEEEKFIKVPNKQSKPKDTYLVLHKTTQEPIGVFDTLEQAITEGKASTYCTCMVYRFKLNEKCVYLNRPIYEDK